MATDLEQVRNYYSRMGDLKLEKIAKFEIASLQPEIQEIVTTEIKKRGLAEHLIVGIKAQIDELSEEELFEIIKKVKSLNCPICLKPDRGLVGGVVRKVRSYLLLTFYSKRSLIACRECVESERKSQLIRNALLGWWGFPLGLYRTPKAIMNHFDDNEKKEAISESILVEFTLDNFVELKSNWENEDKLVDFLCHINTMVD